MGLFTPDDRDRARELAEEATVRPAAVADAVLEEELLSADDAPARVHAARALADAAEADPDAMLARAGDLRRLLGDEADVRSQAERGLSALADHLQERGEAALSRAETRLADGDVEGATAAVEDARERFARAGELFEGGPAGDATLAETIGVRTVGDDGEDLFTPLLDPGRDLPASANWTFTTAEDNQQALEMTVLRAPGEVPSERRRTAEDEALTALHLQGLPPAPAGVPVLEVQAEVDEDGAITAALVDRGTGKRVEQHAGTAAVSREGGAPDRSLPDDVERLLDDVAARVERASEAEPVGPGPEPMGSGPGQPDSGTDPAGADTDTPTDDATTSADDVTTSADDATTPTDDERGAGTEDDAAPTDDDATTAAGPGKHAVARSHAERDAGGDNGVEGPGKRDVERVLEARDDLERAIVAETDDPSVVRDGVEMTVRRLEKAGDDLAAAVRDALATVVDDDADTVAAVREQARSAVDRVDEVLADAGVDVVDPDPGEPSDAERHHVVEKSAGDQPEDHVVAVEQTGFARDGTVRRPAKVQVSDGTTTAAADAATGAEPGVDDQPEQTTDQQPEQTTDQQPEQTPGASASPGADSATDDAESGVADGDGAGDGGSPESSGAGAAGSPGDGPVGPPPALEHDDLTGRATVARGGSADVYRATVGDDGATLAVKEPRFDGTLQRATAERFQRAAETWADLDGHDNVVDVVDWGDHPAPWLAMEYMDGGSLADRTGEFDLEQAVWTAARVADATAHAHRSGVTHLALKPANVLFQSVEGARDVPKVGDWGVAKLLREHAGSVDGYAPRYAAPEQLDDQYGSPGQATDVYALGAVTYELASGRPPFTGQFGRVVGKVITEEPPPLTQVAPDVPADLEAVVERAMAKRPGERYGDVRQLRDDLRSLLSSLR